MGGTKQWHTGAQQLQATSLYPAFASLMLFGVGRYLIQHDRQLMSTFENKTGWRERSICLGSHRYVHRFPRIILVLGPLSLNTEPQPAFIGSDGYRSWSWISQRQVNKCKHTERHRHIYLETLIHIYTDR